MVRRLHWNTVYTTKGAAYVVDGAGRARLRHVTLGARAALDVECLTGLQPGERVVLYPGDRVSEGSRVRLPCSAHDVDFTCELVRSTSRYFASHDSRERFEHLNEVDLDGAVRAQRSWGACVRAMRKEVRRSDSEPPRLLADASESASSTLSEIEARLHYLRSLQGHG
jgi:hypothetical protein